MVDGTCDRTVSHVGPFRKSFREFEAYRDARTNSADLLRRQTRSGRKAREIARSSSRRKLHRPARRQKMFLSEQAAQDQESGSNKSKLGKSPDHDGEA